MQINEIKSLIPSYYTQEEKKQIVKLLIELANIYIESEKNESSFLSL